MSTKHYGEILKKAISESGLTIAEIARNSGVSRETIYRILDEKTPGLNHLLKIGAAIGYEYLRDIPEFKQMFLNIPTKSEQENLTYKHLYFEILEKYTKVLEEKAKYLSGDKK